MTPPRLLVVDDNPAVRDIWSESLSLLGDAVTMAKDGQEALTCFDAAPYDLVLTDLLMPGMDGWQLAEAIRSRGATPIVVISAAASDEEFAQARARGLVLLEKPVHLAEFRRTVEQTVHGCPSRPAATRDSDTR